MPIINMNFAKDLYYLNLKSIPIDFISFMAIYVFLLLIAISIVNCCILFIFSYINKFYVILITLLIIAGLYFSTIYINIITLFRKYYNLIGFQFNNLVAGLLSFLIIMFILNGISYLLIKRKYLFKEGGMKLKSKISIFIIFLTLAIYFSIGLLNNEDNLKIKTIKGDSNELDHININFGYALNGYINSYYTINGSNKTKRLN